MIKDESSSLRTPLLLEDALSPGGGLSFDNLSIEKFTIHYEKYSKEIAKSQQRMGGVSMQRIKKEDAEVIIDVTMLTLSQVADIKVYVKRIVEIENPPFGYVEIEAEKLQSSYDKYRLKINLDSVYMVDDRPVFALAKSNTDERNQFYLRIEVVFIDGSSSIQHTEPFKIVGKAKDCKAKNQSQSEDDDGKSLQILVPYQPFVEKSQPKISKKRKLVHTDSASSTDSLDRILKYLKEPRDIYGETFRSIEEDGEFQQVSKLVANEIKAKTAHIEELHAVNQINTPKGDIAYHFIISDPDHCPTFQEGEIVGIFDGLDDEAVLDRLSLQNAKKSITRGIITRSNYLAARLRDGDARTETICMFGIVPVRVKGPVRSGDAVYCSENDPGLAVSHDGLSNSQNNVAIGVAMESMTAFHDELHLVQCLVSITMEVLGGLMEEKMDELRGRMDSQVKKIQHSRKKSRKKLYICFGSTLIFSCLLGILFWQLFMPCSTFKYWLCKKAMIINQYAEYNYRPSSAPTQLTKVKGAEFRWKDLVKKAKLDSDVKPINSTGFHYYLNIEKCACGDDVGGPKVFAADVTCSKLFFFSTSCKKWCRYYSAQDINCHPFYPKKEMTEILREELCWLTATFRWYCLVT